MPKYRVVINEYAQYVFEVEAEDEELAEDLAVDKFLGGRTHECTTISGDNMDVVEVEEIEK